MKLKLVGALLGAAAVAMVFSGCFALYGVNWSRIVFKPGQKGTETLKSHPFVRSAFHKDRPFFLIGIPTDGSLGVIGGQFDVRKQFGHHPKNLINDNQLRDFIVNNFSSCDYPINTGSYSYKVRRTANNVTEHGEVQKTATSKLTYKQEHLVASNGSTAASVTVAAGGWKDDGDGVPESGEVACGLGSADSALTLKKAPSSAHKVSPSVRREAQKKLGR